MLIDFHNDVAMKLLSHGVSLFRSGGKLQVDAEKIRGTRPDALFCACYSDPNFSGEDAMEVVRAQIRILRENFGHPESPAEIALSFGDLDRISSAGKTAAILTVEGGYAIRDRLEPLEELFRHGVRLLTLTHSMATDWAGSDADQPGRGLTTFGEKVIAKLNELGIIVDVAHASTETQLAAARCSRAPIVYSHGGVRSLVASSRSIADEAIRAIAEKGGVIAMSFYPPHLMKSPELDPVWLNRVMKKMQIVVEDPSVSQLEKFKCLARMFEEEQPPDNPHAGLGVLADNFDHVIELVGDDFVALGSDYDGIPYTCTRIEDLSKIRRIADYLRSRGYSDGRIEKICGLNAKRVIEAVLR